MAPVHETQVKTMRSDRTMMLLADTFVHLTETCPVNRITISKIVEACSRSRKTFYYYFIDIDSLIVWLFRHDLGLLLNSNIDASKLIYEPEGEESTTTAKYPYYVFINTGVRTLDHSRFFALIARAFDSRRGYYKKVLRQNPGPNDLRNYLYKLYKPALQRDIEFILGNRYLQPRNIELLAEFYTGAFVNDLFCRTINDSCRSVEADFAQFGNLVHSALIKEIEEQRLHRTL